MSNMVKIEVITSVAKLSDFKQAVVKLGVSGMTVYQVLGCGVQKGTPEYEDEIHEHIDLLPKQMIMMVVEEDIVDEVIEEIKKSLYTGHIGDGKIFISDIKNSIRIRTGEEGEEALR